MTEHLLEVGNKVIATLCKSEALSDLTARYLPTQLLVIKLDVTHRDDIRAAFDQAAATFGRIDVVLNNAGVNVTGEVKSTGQADARDVFDVNFWGAAHVSQEAVRVFREVNRPIGGRLLQVSSRLGLVGRAACGFYCASKFALEGLSESLADELDPVWNIKITLLEPGPFRTEFSERNFRPLPQHPAYADPALPRSQVCKYIGSPELFDGDVSKAMVVIKKVSQLENPPVRFPLHKRTVATLRERAKEYSDLADGYESWVEDLYHEK